MRALALTSFLFILSGLALSQSQPQLNLMPMPASVQQGAGTLSITPTFSVSVTGVHDVALESGVQRFIAQLSRQTGIPFRAQTGANPTLSVHADKALESVLKLGEDE